MGQAKRKHGQHNQDSKNKDPFMISILLILFSCIFAFAYSNFGAVTAFAGEFLSLTPADVKMIPVGTLLFFIYWQLSDKFLFKPFLAVIQERESMTTGATSAANETLKEAEQLIADYDEQLLSARVEAIQKKQLSLNTLAAWSRDELAKASNEAQGTISAARNALSEEFKASKATMAASVTSLANDIVSKSREIPTSVGVM